MGVRCTYKAKTLKSQLLTKLLIEFYKILNLSSPNIRQKNCFILHADTFFFSLAHCRGEIGVTYPYVISRRPCTHKLKDCNKKHVTIEHGGSSGPPERQNF